LSGLADFGVQCVKAPNASLFTLGGTNTWLLGSGPAWVIDPGPAIDEHLDAVAAAVAARGGAAGIALTHRHADHVGGLDGLRQRLGGPPVAAFRGPADARLADGAEFGPLRAHHVPGHAPDHLVFVAGPVCFTGDAVLGEGSVFVAPGAGGLGAYLDGLRRLGELDLAVLCPGHGPAVWEPRARLEQYVAHREERERRLLAAVDGGARSVEELLDAAWDDVPAALRPAAAVTLGAHLEKLRAEGRLPEGVEEPPLPAWAAEV
jgi:glyoxylase-like metal-dependent hydrolase (beta-lactamase superfamily II)